MGKTFDKLFDEFFNEDKSKIDARNSEIKKVVETISNFKKINTGEMTDEQIEAELGEPTLIESYAEGNVIVTKLIWITSAGQFEKIVVKDMVPVEDEIPIEILEQKLAEAVDTEDYPSAIKLRDELKKRGEKK